MHVEELPLVIFTISAQMSVGAFVVLGLIHLFGARYGRDTVDQVSDPALYAIGPTLVLGLAASTLHLGNPLHAINAFNHLGSSWLSREIVFGMVFAAIGAAFALTQWFSWFTPLIRQSLAFATAVVGLGLIWVMAKVYMLTTVPAWNTWVTPVQFFTTTLLLGALAVGMALIANSALRQRRGITSSEPARALIMSSLHWIAIGAMALIGVQFVVLPLFLGELATSDTAAAAASTETLFASSGVIVARLLLVFTGVGLLGFYLFHLAKERAKLPVLLGVSAAAFSLVLAGEVLGRMMFYASFERIGM